MDFWTLCIRCPNGMLMIQTAGTSFCWDVAKCGHKIIVRDGEEWIVEAEDASLPGARRILVPLEDESDLFLKLAGLSLTKDTEPFIAFANEHGLLGLKEDDSSDERLNAWRSAAFLVNLAIRIHGAIPTSRDDDIEPLKRLLRTNPPASIRGRKVTRSGDTVVVADTDGWLPGDEHDYDEDADPSKAAEDGHEAVTALLNQGLRETVSAQLVLSADWGRELRLVPNSLFGALWLQLASFLETEVRVRECIECGRSFTVRPGRGGPAKRVFCRDKCKSADYKKRRKARELHAGGASVQVIIGQLAAKSPIPITEERVQGWIEQK